MEIGTPTDVLLIGFGNPGRLDDGLGPALAEAIEKLHLPGVTVEADYQLTVEDAAEVARHQVVIFADADLRGPEPFSMTRITCGGQNHAADAPAVGKVTRRRGQGPRGPAGRVGGVISRPAGSRRGRDFAHRRCLSFSSHSVEPQAVLSLARDLFGAEPEAYLMGIRGYEFDQFGETLSEKAQENLNAAVAYLQSALKRDEGRGTRGEGNRNTAQPSGPLDPRPSPPHNRRPEMGNGKSEIGNRKSQPVILVVDDDPDILESLKVVLEANGYAFAGAASASEGLKVYKEIAPSVIIVDLMMEEIDSGTGLVTELKALGNTAPVYMLSSVGDGLSLAADYSSLGLAGVFQKPLDHERLLSILKSKLG